MQSNKPPWPKGNNTRTLSVVPNMGEMVKPAELIEVKGGASLTLADRRLFNILLRNAFGHELGIVRHTFQIRVSRLRDSHDSNDRLVRSIEALMKTVVTVRRPNGSTDRVQLLGWNNLDSPAREAGILKYSIPPELAAMLRTSSVFAKLELEVLRAFNSKFGLALYEAVACRVRLKHKFTELFSLARFREILGVEDGKLPSYGQLNQCAIKPALAEVNALSDFTVTVAAQKTGPKVTGIRMGWCQKGVEARKAVFAMLQKRGKGRKGRR